MPTAPSVSSTLARRRHGWLARAVEQRLREELAKLQVEINEEKSKIVDLANGGSFTFLGFEYRSTLGRNRKWRPLGGSRFRITRSSARAGVLRLLAPQRGLIATGQSQKQDIVSYRPARVFVIGVKRTPGFVELLLPPRQSRGISLRTALPN